jgi:hypothetical protein
MGLLKQYLAPTMSTQWDWKRHTPAALKRPLENIASIQGTALQWLPETALLLIEQANGATATYTLLRNTAHANVSHLLGEKLDLLPEEDTLTLLPDIVGSYPNAFYRLKAADLPELASAIRKLSSEKDYAAFAQRWAVRRDNPGFWAFSDDLLARYGRDEPINAGLLDYNRLEYR